MIPYRWEVDRDLGSTVDDAQYGDGQISATCLLFARPPPIIQNVVLRTGPIVKDLPSPHPPPLEHL